MERGKYALNGSSSTPICAPIAEPGPQQPKAAHHTFRMMRIMCEVLHFYSQSIIAMTEMDHSRPRFQGLIRTESDIHEVEEDTRKLYLLAASV